MIACAGTGSRMQPINNNIHKALLPIDNAPILYHLISDLPEDWEILILLGHKKDQVKDFLLIAFPNHKFKFIDVLDYSSSSAGTATSLKFAKPYLGPDFWYVPCDGFFEDGLRSIMQKDLEGDTIVVSPSNRVQNPCEYAVVQVKDGKAIKIEYKPQNVTDFSQSIFTGLMYVSGSKAFFDQLDECGLTEFVPCLSQNINVIHTDKWSDLGTPSEYRRHAIALTGFDFSKPHEITYILKDRVVKYLSDQEEPERKLIKPSLNPNVYPTATETSGQFFSYRLVDGTTLYNVVTPALLFKLLDWLSKNLWERSSQNIGNDVVDFYVNKSIARINQVQKLLPYDFKSGFILCNDDQLVPQGVVDSINWETFTNNVVIGKIHGDLQFDNILYKPDNSFCLIDWRTSFGKNTLLGDIHYDLAKLLGGIRMNYSRIKSGDFFFRSNGTAITYSFPACLNSLELEAVLFEFALKNGFDVNKIENLTALIYLNMSPMHNRPFSDLLFFHSLRLLKRSFGEY